MGMRRFLLDTGIAGDFVDRRRGVYEHARHEVAHGNRVGIGIPVLAELVYRLAAKTRRFRGIKDLVSCGAEAFLWQDN
jgi:tRNA(fMet)-specific endonuclease VapC